jgi:hypothetical protein
VLLCVGGLCASLACSENAILAPSADEIIVHAVLNTDVRDQFVIVQHNNGVPSKQAAVTGATVSVTTPDGRVLVADEVQDSSVYATQANEPRVTTVYRISLDKYGVTFVPGGAYALRIVIPGRAREIRGSTIIPAASAQPVATATSQLFDRLRDTLVLSWGRVSYAHAYEVSVSSSLSIFAVFADTSVDLPGTTISRGGSRAFASGVTNNVTITAVDANYYDYFRRDSDPYSSSGVISHLDGATGVFGSIRRLGVRVLQVK